MATPRPPRRRHLAKRLFGVNRGNGTASVEEIFSLPDRVTSYLTYPEGLTAGPLSSRRRFGDSPNWAFVVRVGDRSALCQTDGSRPG